jgi:predicted PurR-regulated permease PerM
MLMQLYFLLLSHIQSDYTQPTIICTYTNTNTLQIYSAKLKLHPIIILTVLYVTEHVVGVQGLVVAVPCAVFIINNVLKIGQQKAVAETDSFSNDGFSNDGYGSEPLLPSA